MLKDFRPVLIMLIRFLIIYAIPVVVYQMYLNHYDGVSIDPISGFVAKQTALVQDALGYKSILVEYPKLNYIRFNLNGKFVARMVEGCNAISVIILFLAFIFAFYKGKVTFLFAAIGVMVLHIINVFRIALLNIIILEYPKYTGIAHDYFFPAIIYGTVVILWIIWIKAFVFKK